MELLADENIESLLQRFRDLEKTYRGPIPDSLSFNFGKYSYHVFILAAVHGDEIGSLPAIMKFVEELESGRYKYGGRLTIALGNVEAIRKRKRFVHSDLNRLFFDFDCGDYCDEKNRAKELASVIDSADLLFDFHQTIGPTPEPFYLYENTAYNRNVANFVGGAKYSIVSKQGSFVHGSPLTTRDYAIHKGIPAFTLELSQKGFSDDAELLTDKSLKQLMVLSERMAQNAACFDETETNCDVNNIFLEIVHQEDFDSPDTYLFDGIENFCFYEEGAALGKRSCGADLLMPETGRILFPKYPERNAEGRANTPLPGKIFLVAKEIDCG